MQEAVQISVWNAMTGLVLTPDMAFYATDLQSSDLHGTVLKLHRRQLDVHSYEWFVDMITDHYGAHYNGLITSMMVCAALSDGYRHIRRWGASVLQTAINIYLNSIDADDHCEFPRIVPHALDDVYITTPEQIDRDLLWRIMVTEPWLSYAERARAQYARMATCLGRPRVIDNLSAILRELDLLAPAEVERDAVPRSVRRSINRAFKLHDQLFGLDNLRTLLHHKPLILTGHLYCYSLSLDAGDLILYTKNTKTGVPPIHVTVLRRADQVVLCTLCIYFADTPAIDHLIALTLHLKTEETELDLLRVGQAQNLTRAFFQDPVLPTLKGLSDPVLAPSSFVGNLTEHVKHDGEYSLLRSSFDVPCYTMMTELTTELMGYSVPVLDMMRDTARCTVWDYITHAEQAMPLLDRAKQCFS
jgi:hypothetical protein